MPITTTIGALVKAQPFLERVAAVKLDAKTRYHAMKLAKLVREDVQDHFVDPQEAVMKELGTERPPTAEERQANPRAMTLIDVPLDKLSELNARLTALLAVDVTLPWGPLTRAMLEPYTEITAADWLGLGPLFDLGDDAPNTP